MKWLDTQETVYTSTTVLAKTKEEAEHIFDQLDHSSLYMSRDCTSFEIMPLTNTQSDLDFLERVADSVQTDHGEISLDDALKLVEK